MSITVDYSHLQATMKKHLLRIKQRADQTIFNADKSEVFNTEELQIAHHKTKYFGQALRDIVRALPGSNKPQSQNFSRSLEYSLGTTFREQSKRTEDSFKEIFSKVLDKCGIVELDLAEEYADHEEKLREFVVAPIHKILESTLVNIAKQKRTVTNHILEEDAIRNGSATKQISRNYYDVSYKVEECRNALAYEMCNFVADENDLAGYILQIVKLQRAYHEVALKNLSEVIPLLEMLINDWEK